MRDFLPTNNLGFREDKVKSRAGGYRLENMNVCQAFNHMNSLFNGGFLRQLGWEGDRDQGWAERIKPNQGSMVHTFPREFPVKCKCGERVYEDDMLGHSVEVCPLRPALMGTPFRDKGWGPKFPWDVQKPPPPGPELLPWDDPVLVQKPPPRPKAEPHQPRPEFTKEHVQQMLRRVGEASEASQKLQRIALIEAAEAKRKAESLAEMSEESLEDVDWAELMLPPPFRNFLKRCTKPKLEPGTVKPRPGPRTAVVDGVQMCWGYDRAKRGFGMVPIPCLAPAKVSHAKKSWRKPCLAAPDSANTESPPEKKKKKKWNMGYHPAFKKKE